MSAENWHLDEWRAPKFEETDTVMFSEHGRILDCDYRSHWFAVVKPQFGPQALLVHHGGGHERFSLGFVTGKHITAALAKLSSDERYLLMHALFDIHKDAARAARAKTSAEWTKAAAEGRIKTRKLRGQSKVKVSIEAPQPEEEGLFA